MDMPRHNHRHPPRPRSLHHNSLPGPSQRPHYIIQGHLVRPKVRVEQAMPELSKVENTTLLLVNGLQFLFSFWTAFGRYARPTSSKSLLTYICKQTMRQYPCHFEYNEFLLQLVAEQSYACRFGTFLANNRREQQVHTICVS